MPRVHLIPLIPSRPLSGFRVPLVNKTRGIVLVVVLWVMMILGLMSMTFVYLMRAGMGTAHAAQERFLCLEIAKSGLDIALAELVLDETSWDGPNESWRTNPDVFKEVPLGDGNFTLFYRDLNNDNLTYGLRDESSKLNINTASKEMLMKLPGVTEEIADAIIDWRDRNNLPGPKGAEDIYYASLSPPYLPKNRPFDTVEELLYVKGMTPEILYGEDTNMNGVLDKNEDDGDETEPLDNADGRLDVGLIELVTASSYDLDLTNEGNPRVNLNTASPNQIYSTLSEYISREEIDAILWRAPGFRRTYSNLGRLLDTNISDDTFKNIIDLVTILPKMMGGPLQVQGLVNINTVPWQVLQTLPGIDESTAKSIVSYRAGRSGEDISNIGWLLDVLDREIVKGICSLITTRSLQFSLQSVGVLEGKRIFSRIRAIVDRGVSPPRIIYWKDISSLGYPFHN